MRVLSRRLQAVTAAAALTVSCAACGSSPAQPAGGSSTVAGGAFPVTITVAGAAVHVPAKPATIISLSPTATEMLYAIGAGRQVKAVDADSDYPPQAPRTKLSGLQPNVEAIVARKPNLVVISFDSTGLAKHLAAFSIPVLDLSAPTNVSGVYSQFLELGHATGHLAQAEQEVTTLRSQISQIVAAEPHHSGSLSYYFELDQTYYSITSSTFVGKLLGLLGLKSIADAASGAAAAGGYPQLSAEYIIKANPGYIILADTICCHQDAATVAKRPGWSGLTAVKDKHIILLNDDIASRWGPRITDLLRDVATGITGSGSG